MIIYINNEAFAEVYVSEWPVCTQEITYDGFTCPDDMTFKLDNTDKTIFDPRYAGSVFYNGNNIGSEFSVYDEDTQQYLVVGTIDNVQADDQFIEVTVTSILQGLQDTNCVYTTGTNETPAETIFNLLTDYLEDVDLVVESTFKSAMAYQAGGGLYTTIALEATKEGDATNDGISIGSIFNDLQLISNSHLFTNQNLVYLYQDKPYTGELGTRIYDSDIVSKTFNVYFSQGDPIPQYNSYAVSYNNVSSISYSVGKDLTSIAAYGEKKWSYPESEDDEPNALITTAVGAAFAGNCTKALFKDIKMLCEFKTDYGLNFIKLGDQLDLCLREFIGEPVKVITKEIDFSNKTISFKCIFLNKPTQLVARDTTPPASLYLGKLSSSTGTVLVEFTGTSAVDHLHYRIYFSCGGQYNTDSCGQGKSPAIVKGSTSYSENGYLYQRLTQFPVGYTFSFYITDVDVNFNESVASNILSVVVE